jgi:hypothetical protein
MLPTHSLLPVFYDIRLFLLGLVHSIFPSLALSTSHIVLTQSCLYELNGRKGLPLKQAFTNRWVIASLSGMVLAQLLIMLSIYSAPLYTLWLRPHFWSLILCPYMFSYCYRSLDSSPPISSEQYRYHHPDEVRNLFFESFFGQLINPIIWPTPVLSRVMTSFLFRYSQASMFLAGTIIGSIGGHFLLVFIACLLVYILERYTPTSAKAFNFLFYRFFQYTTIVLAISCASIAPIAIIPKSLPLVQINTMRLRDPWPNVFFDSVIWHRPFWFPKVFGLEDKPNLAEERELKIKLLRKEALRQLKQEEDKTKQKIQQDQKPENKVNKKNKKTKQKEQKVIDPATAFLNYKRFSQFFFRECLNSGKRRLIFNYPESLGACHENLEIALDFPFLSEEPEERLYEEWIEEKTNRRNILYNNIVSRMAAINGLKNTFERIAETKLVSASPSLKKTVAVSVKEKEKAKKVGELYVHLDPRLQSILPGRFDQLKHLNWNVEPIQKVTKLQNLAVDKSNLQKQIPDEDQDQLIRATVVQDSKPSLNLSIKQENRLKHWMILQSEELEYNLIIPWFVLSDKCRLAMPSVLNNQNQDNIAYDAHKGNLSWDTFVDLYESPLPPQYPTELWLGIWRVYLDGLEHVYHSIYQAVKQGLKPNANLSQEAKIIADLQHLQKTFPFLNMTGEEDCKQMINKQLPEPDIQPGRLPFGNNFNSDLGIRNMIPRRRKSQVVKWFRQKTFLSPIFVTFWPKSVRQNQDNSGQTAVRDNKDFQAKHIYHGVSNFIGDRKTNKTPDEIESFGELVNRFRGPLLLAQAYSRRYLRLPLSIYIKHTIRMLLRQTSELEADFRDLAREEYRFLPYSGYDKKEEAQEEEEEEETDEAEAAEKTTEEGKEAEKTAEVGEVEKTAETLDQVPTNSQQEISEIETSLQKNLRILKTQLQTEFPEEWWENGIQVKIVDPFRLKPWRANPDRLSAELNKLREEVHTIADIEEIGNLIGRDQVIQSTFLTVTGDELDFPGGFSISKPTFFRPIRRALLFMIRFHIHKLLARIKQVPLWKKMVGGFSNRLSQIYQTFLLVPIRRFQILIQSSYQFFIDKKKQVIASKEKIAFIKLKPSITSSASFEEQKVRQLKKRKPKTRLSARKMINYPSLNQYLYDSQVFRDGRLIEFPLFQLLPVYIMKSMSTKEQMKLTVGYKSLQLKLLWIQVRKLILFARQSIWNLITIHSPLWIKFQIKLLPTNGALLYRRAIECLDSTEDKMVNSLYNLYKKYLYWRFGTPHKNSIVDTIYLTKAYILQKMWNSKFVINPHVNSLIGNWNDDLRMRSGIETLLKEEGLISEHLLHHPEWDKWLRHIPHFAPPKSIWSLFKLPYWKKSAKLIKQSKLVSVQTSKYDYSLSHLHKKWIRSATNWTKKNKWYQLARSYMNEYTGLRVPRIRLRGRPMIDIGPYVKPYDCKPTHLSVSMSKSKKISEREVNDENYIDVDSASEKYFLFDPNALITVEGYTLAPELTELKKYYGYWKDSDEQMICEFLENLNRPFVQKRQAEEEVQEKGGVVTEEPITQDEFAKLSLGFELLYGENYLSRIHDPEDISNQLGHWVLDFHFKHMKEPIFIYNFIAPLFEFTISSTRQESYLQKHIAWLLDESDKLRICRAYDYIMLADTQREFRVLNLLNITEPLPQSNEKLLAFRSLSGYPEQDVLDRFLWPAHRLEDLACMNRFWFSLGNQSKFSALRVRMYPLVKP